MDEHWKICRVKTARSAANFLRSFLGWSPFLGRISQYNQDHVLSFSPIGSDIWGWFFIKKHSTKCCQFVWILFEMRGKYCPFWGPNFSWRSGRNAVEFFDWISLWKRTVERKNQDKVLSKRCPIVWGSLWKGNAVHFWGWVFFWRVGGNAASFWSWTSSQEY